MNRRIISLLLMCLFLGTVYAQKKFSGQCGEKVKFEVDVEVKKLTLKGSGGLYTYTRSYPWQKYLGDITTLEIVGDVVGLDGHLTFGMKSLTTIEVRESKRYRVDGNCLMTLDSVLVMGCGVSVMSEGIKEIGTNAFGGCYFLTKVSIPESVRRIGDWAFSCCSSLTEVSIPSSVESIGQGAFENCSSLSSVTIGAQNVGRDAFQNDTSLTDISFLSSVRSIDYTAFMGCTALEKVLLPETLEKVDMGAFAKCTALSSVTIGARKIGAASFQLCTSLKDITFLPAAQSIGTKVFKGCTALEKVVLPETLKIVEYGACENCTALRSAVISAARVEDAAFKGCTALTDVTIDSTVQYMGQDVFLGTGLSQEAIASYQQKVATSNQQSAAASNQQSAAASNWRRAMQKVLDSHKYVASVYNEGKKYASFLAKNIRKPVAPEGCKRKPVRVTFLVDAKGRISDVKPDTAHYEGVYKEVLDELLRVVNTMPDMKPSLDKDGKVMADSSSVVIMFPYKDETDVFPIEEHAAFPGGETECMDWLAKMIRYPSICLEKCVQGRVIVSFVVEKDGAITDIVVLRSPDDNLSQEALRVVKCMPKWKPATYEGEPVRSLFNLPVMFQLR